MSFEFRNNEYDIAECSPNDLKYIDSSIISFNKNAVPFTQKEEFVSLNYKIIVDGSIAAGITAVVYCWGCLYIDTLFVDEKFRSKGLGRKLMDKVEKEALAMGSNLAHLDTFDFQAKDFYTKMGYEVFGTLFDCPKNHNRFYMKKVLN